MTNDLVKLFSKYGTDKLINGYAPIYHALFFERRERVRSLLEIGIGTMIPNVHSSMVGYARDNYAPGGSLRAWRDFFPNAEILGMDVQPDTQITENRIRTLLCNSTDSRAVDRAIEDRQFQIIIDDGSHVDECQLSTLRNMYPHVEPDGLYIIEDICPGSRVSATPDLVRQIVGHNGFFFANTKSNICVIFAHPLTDYDRPNY
jgi:hypothetical protein